MFELHSVIYLIFISTTRNISPQKRSVGSIHLGKISKYSNGIKTLTVWTREWTTASKNNNFPMQVWRLICLVEPKTSNIFITTWHKVFRRRIQISFILICSSNYNGYGTRSSNNRSPLNCVNDRSAVLRTGEHEVSSRLAGPGPQ